MYHFYKRIGGKLNFPHLRHRKDGQKLAETRPGLQAAIAKMAGQAVRLTGLLHVLWEVASGSAEIPEEIPFAIVKSGCKLAEFYLGQVTLLQGDGDALNGELTPVLKVLLDKVNDRGSLTATEAKKAVWGLRKITPDKIRQFFNELAAMDLAVVQGVGSRLTLTPKVLSVVDDHQQRQNSDNTRVSEKNLPNELRFVDEVLMNFPKPESLIQQEFQKIHTPTVDDVDEIPIAEIIIQSPKVEPDSDGNNLSVDNPDISINTSTLSTDGSQIPAPQEEAGVDGFLVPASTIEESSKKASTAKLPEFKIGDRVVIADVDKRYRRTGDQVKDKYRRERRVVVDNTYTLCDGDRYIVRFDKPVGGCWKDEFKSCELMIDNSVQRPEGGKSC